MTSPFEKETLEFLEEQKKILDEALFPLPVLEQKKKWLSIVEHYKHYSDGRAKEIYESEQILAEALGMFDHKGEVGPPGEVVCPYILFEISHMVADIIKGVKGNMKFEPKNRRLLIRRVEQDANKIKRFDGKILLPPKKLEQKKGNELYSVIAKANDVKLKVKPNDVIVVEENMIENTVFCRDELEDIIFKTIQENYVKGVVTSLEGEEETT